MGKPKNSFIFCSANTEQSVETGFEYQKIKLVWRNSRSKNAIPVLFSIFGDEAAPLTREMIVNLMPNEKQQLLHTNIQCLCEKLCADLPPVIEMKPMATSELKEETKSLLGDIITNIDIVVVVSLS